MNKLEDMRESEIDDVSGGVPFLIGLGYLGSYLAILDVASDFGAGLGAGLYDGTH